MADASGFVQAVSQLPPYRGLVWRAAGFELPGSFATSDPIPTSRDLRVATENFRAPGVHVFVSTNGREIGMFSAHPAEQEVVILPGARLVPASAFHDVEGLRIQVVIEMPDPDQPLPSTPTDEELATLIRQARSAGEVVVSSPGRFGA